MPWLIAGGFALLSGGYFADKAGEGVNDASTGALKLAAAGAIAFYVAKKAKVI